MIPRPIRVAALACLPLAMPVAGMPSLHAQEGESAGGKTLTESQAASLLEKLDAIRERLREGKGGNNAKALATFRQAAASDKAALALYLDCVKTERFDKEERRESEFRDWKNRHETFHESQEHLAVLRLQLLHLIATIETSEAEELADALPAIENYLDFFFAVEKATLYPDDLEGGNVGRLREVADQPVLDSAFARRYKLDLTLAPPENWPASPLRADQLFERVLMPHYRETGATGALLAAWDRRIAQANAVAALHQEEENVRAYLGVVEEELPRLRWGRARDLFLHRDPLTGARDLLALIEGNLAHPDVEGWISEFQSLVRTGSPAASSEPLEPGAASPPAAPPAEEGDDTEIPATLRELFEKNTR